MYKNLEKERVMSAAYGHSPTTFTNHENKTSPGSDARSAQPKDAEQAEPHELIADRPPPKSDESASAEQAPESTAKPRRPRGFAAMDRKLVSEIARKGGKAAHTAGTAHEFTTEEARVAGRKGGRATHAKRRSGDPT